MFISPLIGSGYINLTYKVASYEVGAGSMFQRNPELEGGLDF
jgi:hypothetical protein